MSLNKLETRNLVATAVELAKLLPQIEDADRVAVDTEADSLHCYREKLCLLQVSLPGRDYVVDPLAGVAGPAFGEQPLPSQQRDRTSDGDRRVWAIQPVQPTGCPPGAERIDLAPLCAALERKEIVLHGADF